VSCGLLQSREAEIRLEKHGQRLQHHLAAHARVPQPIRAAPEKGSVAGSSGEAHSHHATRVDASCPRCAGGLPFWTAFMPPVEFGHDILWFGCVISEINTLVCGELCSLVVIERKSHRCSFVACGGVQWPDLRGTDPGSIRVQCGAKI
jgi:hypothetical protein